MLGSGVNSTQRGPKKVENACILCQCCLSGAANRVPCRDGDRDTSDEFRPRIGAVAHGPRPGGGWPQSTRRWRSGARWPSLSASSGDERTFKLAHEHCALIRISPHEPPGWHTNLHRVGVPRLKAPDALPVLKAQNYNRKAGQTKRRNTTEVNIVSPWERRDRGGLYYTRSRRVAGRVVREYVGTGPLAELAAEIDVEERWQREQQRQGWREECERFEALEQPIEELCEASEILARAALAAAGYRQHNRGEWRKRRERHAEEG